MSVPLVAPGSLAWAVFVAPRSAQPQRAIEVLVMTVEGPDALVMAPGKAAVANGRWLDDAVAAG